MKTVKLELTMTELFRVEMALIEYRVDLERNIDDWIKRLNGSDNITEVKLCNGILKSKREKLKDITNILDKI
tara:strand:+ start:1969 stop:2184 length:216 start_codon:yes stop_codon:yes gene_type:complete